MATNVYNSGTDASIGGYNTKSMTNEGNTIVHYYDRAGVKAANRTNTYGQWASKKMQPTKMGKTFKISKFVHIYDRTINDGDFATKGYLTSRSITELNAGINGAGLTEGDGAVNKRSIEKITMETTLARYGEMIDYTDDVELFSEDDIQVRYREELGELANSRQEDLIQRDMLSTTTVMGSGAAANLNQVDTIASYDLTRKAVRKLVRNRATKNTTIVTGSTKVDTKTIAKSFYAIVGADVKADLEIVTRGGTGNEAEYVYQPLHKYGDAAMAAEGEVGYIHETRFIEAEGAAIYRGEGSPVTATGASGVYTTDVEAEDIQTTTYADGASRSEEHV